jgi:hypothetical protein
MTNDKITISDATTGETIEREMTDAEQAERNAFLAEVEAQAKAEAAAKKKADAAKEAAQAKLAALGLTTDDLKALGL